MGPGALIKRGERSMAVTDFKSAMKWLIADAERNVTKQRYKGLGEMNPSQLVGDDDGPDRAAVAAGADRGRDRGGWDLYDADGR